MTLHLIFLDVGKGAFNSMIVSSFSSTLHHRDALNKDLVFGLKF